MNSPTLKTIIIEAYTTIFWVSGSFLQCQQFQSQMEKKRWEQDSCTGSVPGHLVSLGLCIFVSAAKFA